MIVLPDVVGVSIPYLNTVGEVVAIFGNRIGTELPAAAVWPAARLDPTGGFAPIEFRLDQPRLQVHSFATTDQVAMLGARTLRAALVAMVGYRVPGRVVVRDVTTSSPQLVDEESRTPPISHATFAAIVTVRPDP
jgi:hypothetical protein